MYRILFLSLLLLPGFAMAGARASAPQVPVKIKTATGGGKKITIPFKFVGNLINVRVKVDGHPFHFVFDSGSMNVLTPQAVKTIEGEGKTSNTSHAAAAVRAHRFKVKTLTLDGEAGFHNMVFYIVPLPKTPANTRIDGLFSYGVLKRFVVRIDYANHNLTLIPPADFDAKKAGTAVPLILMGGRYPIVKASIDGLTGRFLVDTGSGQSLGLFAPFAKKHDLYTRYDSTPPVLLGKSIRGPAYGRVARAGKLMIGQAVLKNPGIGLITTQIPVAKKARLAGDIGGRVLKRFTVTFDYANKRMYLKPNKYYRKPMNFNRAGMWFKKTEQGFEVVDVMKGGPAAESGIKVGNVITAVDGKPVTAIGFYKLRKMLHHEAVGTKLKLAIGKGKAAHVVTITLRRLIPKTGGLKAPPAKTAH